MEIGSQDAVAERREWLDRLRKALPSCFLRTRPTVLAVRTCAQMTRTNLVQDTSLKCQRRETPSFASASDLYVDSRMSLIKLFMRGPYRACQEYIRPSWGDLSSQNHFIHCPAAFNCCEPRSNRYMIWLYSYLGVATELPEKVCV